MKIYISLFIFIHLLALTYAQQVPKGSFYAEAHAGIYGAPEQTYQYGGLIGIMMVPEVGLGIGWERQGLARTYNRFQLQARGHLTSAHPSLYYSVKRLIGSSSESFFIGEGDFNWNSTELSLGIQVRPWFIFAGGMAFHHRERLRNGGQPLRIQDQTQEKWSSIHLSLIFTYEKVLKATEPVTGFYGYLSAGFLAMGYKNYPINNGQNNWTGEASLHIGGGYKIRPHLGLGLTFTNLENPYGYLYDNIRQLEGMAIHASGIWEKWLLMGEVGWAFRVNDGKEFPELYTFVPGVENGRAPFIRISGGPRFLGIYTLQIGWLGTPILNGTETFGFFDENGAYQVTTQDASRDFHSFQLTLGIFID